MPTLLDLPRELRDQIYSYILISPSHILQPLPTPKKRHVIILHCTSLPSHQLRSRSSCVTSSPTISLSLLRVCRQIRAETECLVFPLHAFYFADHASVPRVLKAMGQVASRRIERVAMRVPVAAHEIGAFKKACKGLASRARIGVLGEVRLLLSLQECKVLRRQRSVELGDDYDTVLHGIKEGAEYLKSGSLQGREVKEIWVGPGARLGRELSAVLRELHLAWGGRLYWDGSLLWENRCEGAGKAAIC